MTQIERSELRNKLCGQMLVALRNGNHLLFDTLYKAFKELN